jgi:hypothetical protein
MIKSCEAQKIMTISLMVRMKRFRISAQKDEATFVSEGKVLTV